MTKNFLWMFLFAYMIPATANPILHFGDKYSVQMSSQKLSSPALATRGRDGNAYYAVLSPYNCGAIKLEYSGQEYSVCGDCRNYTPIEYLASTGAGEYIYTGITVTSQNRNKIRLESVFSGTPNTSWNIPVGIGYASNAPYCFIGIGEGRRVAYGETNDVYTSTTLSATDIQSFHKYSIDYASGEISFDDNVIHTFTPRTYNTDSANNLYMFTWNSGGRSLSYQYVPMKIKSVKIFIDGELVRDYMPVLDSVGCPAMRDMVTNRCFYNDGTGQFEYPDN